MNRNFMISDEKTGVQGTIDGAHIMRHTSPMMIKISQ